MRLKDWVDLKPFSHHCQINGKLKIVEAGAATDMNHLMNLAGLEVAHVIKIEVPGPFSHDEEVREDDAITQLTTKDRPIKFTNANDCSMRA